MLTLTHHPYSLFTLIYILLINLSNGADLDIITTLLSFKTAISNDPLNSLSNWNTSSNICSWTGITCDSSNHVTGIDLTGKNISGQLPPSLFLLPNIHSLNLSNNQFYGSLPITTFSSSSILHLNLTSNNFTGPIPSPILHSSLSTLDLSNNYLTGKIPVTISNFRNLTYIDLGGNILTGKIPNSITKLTNLQHLTLASNQLTGNIPLNIGYQLPHLKWIYLGYNNLTGIIPPTLGLLTSLQHLDLVYNNLTGIIPPTFGNLTNLQKLFLYGYNLHGTIPTSLFSSSLQNLTALDLSANSLSGEIPETISNLQNLEILHLFSNNFTGKIPFGLSSLPKLRILQLWKNSFTGEIPSDLGTHNINLTIIDLSSNSLTGKLPVNLCRSRKLTKLILFSNKLVGPIPNSLGNCTSLIRVRLMNNRLSGELPFGLTTLPAVNYIDLSANHFNGSVTKTKWVLPNLQMLSLANNRFHGPLPEITGKVIIETLDLSNNRFSGGIHRSYGELPELMELNLSKNEVGDEIPSELSLCKKMVRLDLSHNKLTGRIPKWIGELPVLGELDLSVNQFVGEIPINLGRVDSLVQVNLSFNHLVGSLPSTPAFLDISYTAVMGNELCGGDSTTTTRLPACNSLRKSGTGFMTWWSLLVTSFLILILAITVICTIYSLIIILIRRKTVQSVAAHSSITFQKFISREDSSSSSCHDSVWEYHLFKSFPNNTSIHQIISSITTTQKTIILIEDSRIMVERQFIHLSTNGCCNTTTTSVDEVITKLSQIPHHRNLLRINGVCRKLVKKECYEVYLIYEIPVGGSEVKNLSSVLHGLNWEQRSKVVIDVCKVLKYLHCNGMVIGDLSSERILIDDDGECLMRPSLVGGDKPYFAPETKTANTTRMMKMDIYGFGVLLIELLTGKSPTTTTTTIPSSPSTSRHQHDISIVEWARHCYSDSHFEIWIDPVINRFNNHQDQMIETMRLALHCTANETEMRPCVTHVMKTLMSIMKKKTKISLPCVV